MTEEDIMLMAQKAGPLTQGPFKEWCKRFAALVAAHERDVYEKIEQNPTARSAWAACIDNRDAIRARGNT